jgi:hypothetical protein
VVGSLERHVDAWECLKTSNVVLRWVCEGVNLVFVGEPPPPYRRKNMSMNKEEWKFADKEIKGLVEREVVRVAVGTPKGISSLKVAPKKGPRKFRLCVNMH